MVSNEAVPACAFACMHRCVNVSLQGRNTKLYKSKEFCQKFKSQKNSDFLVQVRESLPLAQPQGNNPQVPEAQGLVHRQCGPAGNAGTVESAWFRIRVLARKQSCFMSLQSCFLTCSIEITTQLRALLTINEVTWEYVAQVD